MFNLGQKGVAGLTVAVAAVAIAGASAGTPMAVDEADVQPDSPLYSLEKAGESIKEATYAGGQDWNIERAEERTQEFKEMAKKGKGGEFKDLTQEASERLNKAAKQAGNENGLERAQKALRKHVKTLERVRENVPEQAQAAISLAISASTRSQATLAKVQAGEIPAPEGGGMPEKAKEELDKVREKTKEMKREVEENIERAEETGENAAREARRAINRIETKTAKKISEEIENMANRGKPEDIERLAEEAENRINAAMKAAVDNTGIARAIKASQKHLSVLKDLENTVPEQARESIQKAISNGQKHIQKLERVREQLGPENIPAGGVEGIMEGISEEDENESSGEGENKENAPIGGNGPA